MIASQAPKNRSGYALGTLATGMIGGSLIGPLLGGMLAEWLGIRQVFLLVGFILLICNFLTVFLIKEDFKPVAKANAMSTRELFYQLRQANSNRAFCNKYDYPNFSSIYCPNFDLIHS